MSWIQRLLTPERPAEIPAGIRVYAIGDIHGRDDLLQQLMQRIEADQAQNKIRRAILIFLGDYIDRGPSSSQVIDRLIDLGRKDHAEPHFLMGNHEEVLLRVLAGDVALFRNWLRYSSHECLESYGVDGSTLVSLTPTELSVRLKEAIPRRHRQFLQHLGDTVRVGDYLFVHAGLRPNLALEAQSQEDLRWIRSPFLEDEMADHGYMVVHGHSITADVDRRPNRIGIDTGAYKSGMLTALVLEGTGQRVLQTEPKS